MGAKVVIHIAQCIGKIFASVSNQIFDLPISSRAVVTEHF